MKAEGRRAVWRGQCKRLCRGHNAIDWMAWKERVKAKAEKLLERGRVHMRVLEIQQLYSSAQIVKTFSSNQSSESDPAEKHSYTHIHSLHFSHTQRQGEAHACLNYTHHLYTLLSFSFFKNMQHTRHHYMHTAILSDPPSHTSTWSSPSSPTLPERTGYKTEQMETE